MATQKQKQKDGQQNKLSRPPKLRTVKSESQGQDLTREQSNQTARERAILQKDREDYRHSGIPMGSDPRE